MDLNTIFIRLILASSLGALMGLERDVNWKDDSELEDLKKSSKVAVQKFSFIKSSVPASSLGGVRTYILISLLGSLAGLAYAGGVESLTWVITVGLIVFIQISFVLNYFDKNTLGLTTEISLILNFVLSMLMFATEIPIRFLVAVAVFDIVILSMKDQMRSIVSQFSKYEIADTIKFVLLAGVIWPLLPNQDFGLADIPLFGPIFENILPAKLIELTAIFNPYSIWTLVILILGINFVGYFLTKALGKSRGLNLVGFVGGLVSSTLVTESMARNGKIAKSTGALDSYLSAAVLANLSSFLRVLLVTTVLNFSLGLKLAIPILAMAGFLLLWVLTVTFVSTDSKKKKKSSEVKLDLKSPLRIVPAINFAALYVGVLFLSKTMLYYLGDKGYVLSSILSSLTGMDPVVITTSGLAGSEISYELAVTVIVISAAVNLIVKIFFSAIVGGTEFRRRITRLFLLDILIGVFAMLLVVY